MKLLAGLNQTAKVYQELRYKKELSESDIKNWKSHLQK